MEELCPICKAKLVMPFGRARSQFLLVGEYPGWREIQQSACWVGEAGDVLKRELQRAGISYQACRASNLWLHAVPTGKSCAEQKRMCFDFCFGRLLEQLSTARAVLLMGSELAPLFTGMVVSKINGAKVTSKYINPETIVVASYNPAIVLQESGVVGDFRFAVENFASLTHDLYMEMLHARQSA